MNYMTDFWVDQHGIREEWRIVRVVCVSFLLTLQATGSGAGGYNEPKEKLLSPFKGKIAKSLVMN